MGFRDLVPRPLSRKLRIFAFDPSVASRFDMAGISEITIHVPWEPLKPGPIGEYIEVVDVDPASEVMYVPVNLDEPALLAQDGHAPSESNPQFHQQMVYAVAMATIRHFEQALGRVALWSPHRADGSRHGQFVRRLRIYPHALRDANAYYSPQKKALLFGYFQVGRKDRHNTPGTLVHTCLSHDIIAHETAHALLDGVHPRFGQPVNADVLAFHEAFADIVALFQHFAYPGILRDQIARTRGDLESQNLLGQLAQQFGLAGGRSSLRDALGEVDKTTGQWRPHDPDPRRLEGVKEAHDRGAILVAAVFRAFTTVYKARTQDLRRIASEGTGILRAGEIHPDLAGRLAEEAARCATYVLQMCIRAIDYCPPVGITFGDYLRAVVTADTDLNPDDPLGYRLAFVESFRAWGIYPRGMRSMSVESLLWPSAVDLITEQIFATPVANDTSDDRNERLRKALGFMEQVIDKVSPAPEAGSRKGKSAPPPAPESPDFGLSPVDQENVNRLQVWEDSNDVARGFARWFDADSEKPEDVLPFAIGIAPFPESNDQHRRSIFGGESAQRYTVEIHSVRTANRRGRHGNTASELVIEITQRRRGYFDLEVQKRIDIGEAVPGAKPYGDFRYRAGCTLLVNPKTMEIRRVIRTAGTIDDDVELERVRAFLTGGLEPSNAFTSARAALDAREPFALLHRSEG